MISIEKNIGVMEKEHESLDESQLLSLLGNYIRKTLLKHVLCLCEVSMMIILIIQNYVLTLKFTFWIDDMLTSYKHPIKININNLKYVITEVSNGIQTLFEFCHIVVTCWN